MKARRWLWPLGIAVVAFLGTVFISLLFNVQLSSRMVVRLPDPADVSVHPIDHGLWANGTSRKPPTGIWVLHDGERWRAFSNQPPHPLGCKVVWDVGQKQFVEPCLGEVFDRTGVNVAGPTPRGLDEYPVSLTETGAVQIDLSKPTPAKR